MVTGNELSHAATVLDLLIEQHEASPASARTSELFDTIINLPGAYAVVKGAQAQGNGDPQLLADIEGMIMLLDRPLGKFREEIAAWAAFVQPHRKEMPSTIAGLLAALKRADDSNRIGRMGEILEKIVETGKSSEKPGEIIIAMEEFAKKEPQLAGKLQMAMEKIKLAARASFMERLANMKKDFPNTKDLRAPKPGKPGQLPMPCKN